MAVKPFYTNIPNSGGIAAAKNALDKKSNKTVVMKVITTFLSLILTLNNFVLNCRNSLQIKGCIMGNIWDKVFKNGPSEICGRQHLRQPLLGPFFKTLSILQYFVPYVYIYPLIKTMSVLYRRYIDGIFMMQKGNCDELANFLDNINKQHQTIKFDFVISEEAVSFLDTKVYIDRAVARGGS